MNEPFLTVVTPTYNRAHTLHRVHDSLAVQKMRSFEWLIVDDGSIDDTASLVAGWSRDSRFPIRYLKKPNGGKHTAVNLGWSHAKGEFTIILDSDDAFTNDAFETIASAWFAARARGKPEINVLAFLAKDDLSGAICGDAFPKDGMVSTYSLLRHKYKLDGEWVFVVRTKILANYRQPEIRDCDGRSVQVREEIAWRRMSKEQLFLLQNRAIRIYHTHDGEARITNDGDKRRSRLKIFTGDYFSLNEDLHLIGVDPAYFVRCARRYLRLGCLMGFPVSQQIAAVEPFMGKLLCLLVAPAAVRKARLDARKAIGSPLPRVALEALSNARAKRR